MRRAKPLSVRVKAPSRGIISRWPGLTADEFASGNPLFNSPGLASRAAATGSNVRYEDGVVCNAPGYRSASLSGALLAGIVSHWRMEEVSGTRFDSTLNHHNLGEVDGSEPSVVDGISETIIVGQVPGELGFAAMFPSVRTPVTVSDSADVAVSLQGGSYEAAEGFLTDSLTFGISLSGFQSPVFLFPDDHLALTYALSGGAMTSVIVGPPDVTDKLDFALRLSGGAYSLTVVPESVSDSLTFAVSFSGGSYVKVVTTETTTDSLSLTPSLSGGTYTETIQPYDPAFAGFEGYIGGAYMDDIDEGEVIGLTISLSGGHYG